MATAVLASAMGFIDGSVVSIAIPQIRESLDASFVQAQWVSNSYFLFMSALILLGGAAGDRFGLRRTFGAGIVLFLLASVLCAIAWNPEFLIVVRALQGIGAAIMVPGSMAIIALNFPRGERGRALGIWIAASSVTTAFGPMLGGLLLTYGGDGAWRWIFALNVPLGSIALAMLWFRVPRDKPQSIQGLDWVGAILATLSLGGLAYGFTLLGEGGDSSLAFTLISFGVLLLILTLFWWRIFKFPMIDLRLFSSRIFSGANIITFMVWGGLGAVFFFLPMVLVTGWGFREIEVAGTFLPFAMIIAPLSPIIGRLADRFGTRFFLTLGPLVAASAYAVMAFGFHNHEYWYGVLPAMVLLGLSMAVCASPISTAVMGAVEDHQTGSASGINNMVARMSGLMAVAALGAIVTHTYAAFIRTQNFPVDIQQMMIDAGFAERLSGALYQISTQEAQIAGMDNAMVVI